MVIDKIMEQLKSIKYGWMDKNGNKHTKVDDSFSSDYILETPEEVIKNKIGVCWDQVELERSLFEKENIPVKTYFIVHYDNKNCPTHTFLTYEKDGKHYWFEHSWEIFEGIHEYESEQELLLDVRSKFIENELNDDYVFENICLHEYEKPKFHLTVQEFYKHCDDGKYIEI